MLSKNWRRTPPNTTSLMNCHTVEPMVKMLMILGQWSLKNAIKVENIKRLTQIKWTVTQKNTFYFQSTKGSQAHDGQIFYEDDLKVLHCRKFPRLSAAIKTKSPISNWSKKSFTLIYVQAIKQSKVEKENLKIVQSLLFV